MTGPQPVGSMAIGGRARAPFDWMQTALRRPKVFVIGNVGSGRSQYCASLPFAGIANASGMTMAIAPSSRGTVARMASAVYQPGEAASRGASYAITLRGAASDPRMRIALTTLPDDVVDDWRGEVRLNDIQWRANAPFAVAGEIMPLQEHVATAVGLVFIVDPATLPHRNRFVLEMLQRITQVIARWREAGVSNLPSVARRVPIVIAVAKSDALEPGHALQSAELDLATVVGRQSADGISALSFAPECVRVSAWGEGAGARHAGTRFTPDNVLAPIRAIVSGLPNLVRASHGMLRLS